MKCVYDQICPEPVEWMIPARGIIFDFGGTLIYDNHNHFEQANAWMLANFLRSRGFNLDPENFTQRLMYLRQNLPKGDDNFKQVNTTLENLIQVTQEFGVTLSGDFLLECEKVFVTPEAQGSILLPEIRQVLEETVETVSFRSYLEYSLTSTGYRDT